MLQFVSIAFRSVTAGSCPLAAHQVPRAASHPSSPSPYCGMGLFHCRCRTSTACKMERTAGHKGQLSQVIKWSTGQKGNS